MHDNLPIWNRGEIRARFVCRAALLLLAAGLAATPVAAQINLLQNGSFPTATVTPWTDAQGYQTSVVSWSSVNYTAASSGSGSLVVYDHNGWFLATSAYSECVRISGGAEIVGSGEFKAAAGTPQYSSAYLAIYFYSDTSCSSYLTSSQTANMYASSPQTSWFSKVWAANAPANARAAKLVLSTGGPDGAEVKMHADDLMLTSSNPNDVPPGDGSILKDGFESGNFAAWAASYSG